MPTYSPAPEEVSILASALLCQFETHKLTLDSRVKIDYVFARGDVDPDTGERINDAIKKDGFRVLGQTRIISLKDRAMGRGDVEIVLDADHWDEINEEQQRAILDHELHHVTVKVDLRGVVRDDLGRPKLKLRKHDVQLGWFSAIAARHGNAAEERIQAKRLADNYGQYFWPDIFGKSNEEQLAGTSVTIKAGDKSVTVSGARFSKIASGMAKPPEAE